jgi:preprotein translocase subunit SecD
MKLSHRVFLIILLVVTCVLYVFPWSMVGITNVPNFVKKPFTLGLDLQGGVELDYKVDLDAVRSQSGAKWSEQSVIE